MASIKEELARDTHLALQELSSKHDDVPLLLNRGDDVELAGYVVGQLGERVIHDGGAFYSYNKETGIWDAYQDSKARMLIMELAGKKIRHKNGETKTLRLSSGQVDGILKCIKSLVHRDGFFKQQSDGVAMKDYFVMQTKGGLIGTEHSHSHRATSCMDLKFDSKDVCDEWLHFLYSLFDGDIDATEKIDTLGEFIGACMVGVIGRYERVLWLHGRSGANGKSVFLDTIRACFPSDVVCAIPPARWNHEYYRAGLFGKKINIVSEVSDERIKDTSAMKAIISGDLTDARRPYGETFYFEPKCGHIFSANSLPVQNDHTPAMWRRPLLIEFNKSFQNSPLRRDKEELKEQLFQERQGIVMWALLGAQRLFKRGTFSESENARKAIVEWRKSGDDIEHFVEQNIDRDDMDNVILNDVVYTKYKTWCAKNGLVPLSSLALVRRMAGIGFPTIILGGKRCVRGALF